MSHCISVHAEARYDVADMKLDRPTSNPDQISDAYAA